MHASLAEVTFCYVKQFTGLSFSHEFAACVIIRFHFKLFMCHRKHELNLCDLKPEAICHHGLQCGITIRN